MQLKTLSFLLASMVLTACGSARTHHSHHDVNGHSMHMHETNVQASASQKAETKDIKVDGLFTGTLPCADCSGIKVELSLKKGSYTLIEQYLEKSDGLFTNKGKFSVKGDVITLDNGNGVYRVHPAYLERLDSEGKPYDPKTAKQYELRRVKSAHR